MISPLRCGISAPSLKRLSTESAGVNASPGRARYGELAHLVKEQGSPLAKS